jgi:uncharacterized protein YkvS
MKERFEGPANRSNLIASLKRQEFVCGSQEIAEAMVSIGQLVEYHDGDRLIVQDAHDNEVLLLLAGVVLILING